RLRRARIAVVGCGALGSTLAEMMVRAGVAALTVIDRDYVEESYLQRQSLFDEDDAARGLPTAAAAEAGLTAITCAVAVRAVVPGLHGGAVRLSGGGDGPRLRGVVRARRRTGAPSAGNARGPARARGAPFRLGRRGRQRAPRPLPGAGDGDGRFRRRAGDRQ